jgi:hypothetical protein
MTRPSFVTAKSSRLMRRLGSRGRAPEARRPIHQLIGQRMGAGTASALGKWSTPDRPDQKARSASESMAPVPSPSEGRPRFSKLQGPSRVSCAGSATLVVVWGNAIAVNSKHMGIEDEVSADRSRVAVRVARVQAPGMRAASCSATGK